MNEQELIERTTEVLAESGAPENVEAAGIFNPRGHTGSMVAGGIVGDGIAGAGPDLVNAIGTVGGAVAGAKGHDATTGLPEWLVVAAPTGGPRAGSPIAAGPPGRSSASSAPSSRRMSTSASTSASSS